MSGKAWLGQYMILIALSNDNKLAASLDDYTFFNSESDENLPEPEILAAETVENLEAALERFKSIHEEFADTETIQQLLLPILITALSSRLVIPIIWAIWVFFLIWRRIWQNSSCIGVRRKTHMTHI